MCNKKSKKKPHDADFNDMGFIFAYTQTISR